MIKNIYKGKEVMNNEHLVPVNVLDLIKQYHSANPNSNEKAVYHARLIAIKNKLEKVLD